MHRSVHSERQDGINMGTRTRKVPTQTVPTQTEGQVTEEEVMEEAVIDDSTSITDESVDPPVEPTQTVEKATPGMIALIEKLAQEVGMEVKNLDRLSRDSAKKLITKLKIANGSINELASDSQKQFILNLAEKKGVSIDNLDTMKKETAKRLITKLKNMPNTNQA